MVPLLAASGLVCGLARRFAAARYMFTLTLLQLFLVQPFLTPSVYGMKYTSLYLSIYFNLFLFKNTSSPVLRPIVLAKTSNTIFTSFAHFEAKVATRSAHRRSHGKGGCISACCANHPFINGGKFELHSSLKPPVHVSSDKRMTMINIMFIYFHQYETNFRSCLANSPLYLK